MERAGGRIGKDLARLCATKLVYGGLPEEKYYGRIQGTTREWGTIDYAIAYEDISRTAGIIDWRHISKEDRTGLGRSPVADLVQ